MKEDSNMYSQKSRDIAGCMESIMHKQEWTTHIEEQFCSIRTCEGSPFNSSQPVLYVKLIFSKGTSHEGLLKILTSPSVRLEWDNTFKSMEINHVFSAWHYITRTIVDTQIPFFKQREFLEEKIVTRDDHNLVMLFHSIDMPVSET